MTDGDTLPQSEKAPLTTEGILLAGLTGGGDESPALGVIDDACRELAALSEIIGLELTGEPLDRPAMITLLDGIERRLRAGLMLLRRQGEREDSEVTKDATPGGVP